VLTGWTVTGRGQFTFKPSLHDQNAKTVLGVTIQPQSGDAGQNEGEQVLDILVHHPSTARFIATKMLKWMVTPTPAPQQITAIASVYRATGGDIKSMLRAMLNRHWITASPMTLKRPFHLAVSALRAVSPAVHAVSPLNNALATLGHQPFAWETPDGYPDKLEYWAGNILPRWSFASSFANLNSETTIQKYPAAYKSSSPAGTVDLIDQNFFGGEMPAVTRTALTAYAGTGTLTDGRTRELIALALASNSFQWY
jgi:uncharacterized protein (DUF1800 family)